MRSLSNFIWSGPLVFLPSDKRGGDNSLTFGAGVIRYHHSHLTGEVPMRKFGLIVMLCAAATMMAAQASSIYDFTMKSIDGQQVSLSSYHGKVVLLVNVASKCGFTPQYTALESLS